MIGIYKITNKINGKIYIGQSMNIERRLKEHMKLIKEGSKGWYKEAKETGIENFTFEVIQECPVEELNDMEDYYIKKYKAIKFGYNTIGVGVETGVRSFINDKNIPAENGKITISLSENLKLFKDLKYSAYMLLMILFSKGKESKYTLSSKEIMSLLGTCERTVDNAFSELKKKKYVEEVDYRFYEVHLR